MPQAARDTVVIPSAIALDTAILVLRFKDKNMET